MLRLNEPRSAINNTSKFQLGGKYEVGDNRVSRTGILKTVDSEHVVLLETIEGDIEIVIPYSSDMIFRKLTEEQYTTILNKSKTKSKK